MSKRAAQSEDNVDVEKPLKGGSRPVAADGSDEEEFEDEFEDDFSDEDEILEAGVDGRPDAEREAEEKGMWFAG